MNNLQGKTVLLVDDEDDIRDAIAMLLETLDMEVTQARNGADGLEKYQLQPFDFVVTDYSMPIMKGDAFTTSVKAINPNQRIIMVSGFCDDVPHECRQLLDGILPKPCKRSELAEALVKASRRGGSAQGITPQPAPEPDAIRTL